jgi:hypothetical protein
VEVPVIAVPVGRRIPDDALGAANRGFDDDDD